MYSSAWTLKWLSEPHNSPWGLPDLNPRDFSPFPWTFSLADLQPHWSPFCSLTVPRGLLPHGLSTCYLLFLPHPLPSATHKALFFTSFMSPFKCHLLGRSSLTTLYKIETYTLTFSSHPAYQFWNITYLFVYLFIIYLLLLAWKSPWGQGLIFFYCQYSASRGEPGVY